MTQETMTRASLLDALDEDERARLLAKARSRVFTTDQELLREGDEGSSMLFVEKGSVAVTCGGTLLATLEAGAAIGEMALLDPAPRSATVTARSQGRAWELEREALWDLLATGDSAAVKALQHLTATVCGRLDSVNRQVQDQVVKPDANVFSRLWRKVTGS